MMFGEWGNPDHDDSIKIINTALDAGINFIDTADIYSSGESEEIVGKAIAGRREELVIATQVYSTMSGNPNDRGTSRRWIIQECENSPAVTSPIIGPRTAEHLDSHLGAVDIQLSDDVLDQIDAIVTPGTNYLWADAGYSPPGIADTSRRRRPPATA